MEKFNKKKPQKDEIQEKEASLLSLSDSLELQQKSHERSLLCTNYEENVVTCEQPSSISRTLNCTSRSDSYFMQVTGLDFLIGVPEILLLQTTDDITSSGSKFLVKIPKGETLYMGLENSSTIQRALFCSRRNFNMSFLDPMQNEAATFVRKGAHTNIAKSFRQEMEVYTAENGSPIGRILQDNTLSAVSFTIFDDKNQIAFKILGSKNSVFGKLHYDVHFSILNPVHRTGGVIIHKWDAEYRDFLYHITFPSCDVSVKNKILLIGAALLVEYTYFKKPACCCFA